LYDGLLMNEKNIINIGNGTPFPPHRHGTCRESESKLNTKQILVSYLPTKSKTTSLPSPHLSPSDHNKAARFCQAIATVQNAAS
jgi:hypothetical protein